MRLDESEARRRLEAAAHGVLVTLHPRRGPDPVPVVFAVSGSRLFIPIDTTKAKTSLRLQRLGNIEHDARVALLVEHYSDDWSRLWWVRVHGKARSAGGVELAEAGERLVAKYPQYAATSEIAGAIAIGITQITGWAAG